MDTTHSAQVSAALPIDSQFRRAVNEHATGNFPVAAALYEQILRSAPAHVDALHNLGAAHLAMGRLEMAIETLQRVLQLAPENASAYSNLGYAFLMLSRYDLAEQACAKAIALKPGHVDAHSNLADSYSHRRRYADAARSFQTAFALNPQSVNAALNLLLAQRYLCNWRHATPIAQLAEILVREELEKPSSQTIRPFTPVALFDDPQLHLRVAQRYSQELGREAEGRRMPTRQSRTSSKKIRLGYVSNDFCDNVVAQLTRRVYELHDRERFQVNIYSYSPDDGSRYRRDIEAAADRFVPINHLDNEQAARRLYEDEIDILIDLKGYTTGHRAGIGAYRPAPIQIAWLGYPGTTGAEWIDYIIADPLLIPESRRPDFSERVLYLPYTYLPTDDQRPTPQPIARSEFGLPSNAVVFASFNSPYKIEPESFSAWMEILRQVPNSVLWMFVPHVAALEHLHAAMRTAGVDSDRLIHTGGLPLEQHIQRMQCADLVLDSWVYNGHTTSAEALWAGRPVLAKYGTTFASRVSAGILRAVGLDELVAHTATEYIAKAVELGSAPARLQQYHRQLTRRRSDFPLFDSGQFVRNLEHLFEKAWTAHCADERPQFISCPG